jgi:predicted dehydrogenase
MSKEQKMKIAIVGTSRIAEQFASAVAECQGIEAAAVYSRTAENAKRFAGAHNIPETYTDLEELAKSPGIDAVYIASPNSYHAEQSTMMMRGGKHVLCEKPVATSAAEFSQMLSAAKENNVVLLEASMHLFSPGIGHLRSLLPEIGAVRRVSLVMNQYSSRYDAFKRGEIHNVFKLELAGGAMLDIGIYNVELMVALFGEPESIVSSSIFLHTGVDGQGAVIAEYEGFIAELSHSKISQSYTPCAIQGEEGSLMFAWPSIIDKIDVIIRSGEKRQVKCMGPENQMIYEIQAFLKMAKNPKEAAPYNEISMISQKIMDKVLKRP